ncbi:hypothetical protein ACS5NO_32050 [Larkinella sp. GY13]|uniref:hypothetical protein n=1 Tax=Larkinella sp. GY13 TaxID=3453720 RepID=UPI003EEBE650
MEKINKDVDHDQNLRVALEWALKQWASLRDEYDQIPEDLRQFYVDQMASVMEGFSDCDYKIEGDDNLNVDTFWVFLYPNYLDPNPSLVLYTHRAYERINKLPFWASIAHKVEDENFASLACRPRKTLPEHSIQ